MPDLDVISERPDVGWRAPFRLLMGSGSEDEVGHAAICSLCRSLRRAGGVPGLERLVSIITSCWHDELSLVGAFDQLHKVEQECTGHLHTKLAARAGARVLVDFNYGDRASPEQDPASRLAVAFCEEVIDHHLFGRARPNIVGTRFGSQDDELRWELQCMARLQPRIERVACHLLQYPTAAGLRAPSAPRSLRMTTEEILSERLN